MARGEMAVERLCVLPPLDRTRSASILLAYAHADQEMVGEAVLVDGLAHAAERLRRGDGPVLSVPGKRRIFIVSGLARIGAFR